ncbi:hypothetical protein ACFYVL_42400 [Streptomyces sp. NPDC004111]|uniref:hypothetical protein n=1 Tax=Streptomyces sp. NPDC004111 TaxID=3364690 RepID=UPI003692F58A
MFRYAFLAAPSAVADAPKAARSALDSAPVAELPTAAATAASTAAAVAAALAAVVTAAVAAPLDGARS